MRHFIIIGFLLAAVAASGQIYIDSYRFGQQLLLNQYPGASAAYSLRRIDGGYMGNAIMVRRSSDGDSLNIGFLNNYLDTVAMKNFCGTGGSDSCFVRRWYDQTGNNQHGEMTTNVNQPLIMIQGVVNRSGGEVAVNVIGRRLLIVPYASYLHNQNQFYAIAVNTPTGIEATATTPTIFAAYTSLNYKASLVWSFSTSLRFGVGGRRTSSDAFLNTISNTDRQNNQVLVIGHLNYNTGVANLFENTINVSTNNSFHIGTMDNTDAGVIRDNIGGWTAGQGYDGHIHEFIIYATNQSTNRSGIETNINNFYSIY